MKETNKSIIDGKEWEYVIIGGGAVGCGVAYSLAMAGVTDVLLIERADALGAVTTSQGAGLCGQMRTSTERTRLAMHSAEVFRTLQRNGNVKPDWSEVGSLRLALTDTAVRQFEQLKEVGDACGLESEMIDATAAKRLWPAMNFDQTKAVLWCPSDGYMVPKSVVNAYRSACEQHGVQFVTGTAVDAFVIEADRITAVKTSRGTVACRYVINAAGAHAYHIAKLAGLDLPIVPVRHEYFVTMALDGLDSSLPCFRIPDLTLYGRADGQGLLLGGWEPDAMHTDPRNYAMDGTPPEITPDEKILKSFETMIADLFPGAVDSPKLRIGKGWPTFTPDGQFIIGQSSSVPGFIMAGGCNAHGISGSGGIGKLLVESLFSDAPSDYVRSLSPDRFAQRPWNWEDAAVEARSIYETYYAAGLK
jgi:glycine/D-amino acid oxidase-like deaminating enzyme